ncbi:MAG: hypothetical protein HZC23_08245 [Rhodocyclales bacterium]|nr:hypothetical protein [Rhodocyclales bacterium]
MTMNKTIAAFLVATSLVVQAADRREPTIEELMAVSGIKVGLDKMPAQIATQLFGNMPASTPETARRDLMKGYAEAFPDGAMTVSVTRALKSANGAPRITRLINAATTPTSMKMTALELKEPNEKELRDFAATMQSKPPSRERVAVLKEILDATHAVDIFSTIAVSTSESMAIAASSGCSDDIKSIRAELVSHQPAIREGVFTSMMFSMMYTYRTAADEELREYLASYRDPDVSAFHAQLAKLATKEYLSRWKSFEKTLYRLGGDLSGRSMFAKSCRKTAFLEPTEGAKTKSMDTTALEKSSFSGKDARECLDLADNIKIASCTQKYR